MKGPVLLLIGVLCLISIVSAGYGKDGGSRLLKERDDDDDDAGRRRRFKGGRGGEDDNDDRVRRRRFKGGRSGHDDDDDDDDDDDAGRRRRFKGGRGGGDDDDDDDNERRRGGKGPIVRPPTGRITCANVRCAGPCRDTRKGPVCIRGPIVRPPTDRITCANVRCAGPCRDTPKGPVCIREPIVRPGECPASGSLARALKLVRRGCGKCAPGERCCPVSNSKRCLPTCSPRCLPGQTCRLILRKRLCKKKPCLPQTVAQCQPDCRVVRCGSNQECRIIDSRAQCVSPRPTPGTCPVDNVSCLRGRPGAIRGQCSFDTDCPSDQKCCRRGCVRRCMPVCRSGCARCIFSPIACVTAPCPEGVATCEDPIPIQPVSPAKPVY